MSLRKIVLAVSMIAIASSASAGGLSGKYCSSDATAKYWFIFKPDGTGTYYDTEGYTFAAEYSGDPNFTIRSKKENGVEFYFYRREKDLVKTGESTGRTCSGDGCVYHKGHC